MITFLLLLITLKRAGHSIKWGHFDILAFGKTGCYCKVKKILVIQELQPALIINVSSEIPFLYYYHYYCYQKVKPWSHLALSCRSLSRVFVVSNG